MILLRSSIAELLSTVSSCRCTSKSGLPETRATPRPKKLPDHVRDAMQLKQCAYSTEKTYIYLFVWAKKPRRLPTVLTKEKARQVIPAP